MILSRTLLFSALLLITVPPALTHIGLRGHYPEHVSIQAGTGRVLLLEPELPFDRFAAEFAPFGLTNFSHVEGSLAYFPGGCDWGAGHVPPHVPERVWLFNHCNGSLLNVLEASRGRADALLFTKLNWTEHSAAHSYPEASRAKVPVASVSEEAALLLMECKEEGLQVKVWIDAHRPDWVNCAAYYPLAELAAAFFPFWVLLVLLWAVNTWRCYPRSATPMQKFLLLPGLLKAMLVLATYFMWMQCPDFESRSAQYLFMAFMGLTTMHATLFFASLLLLAKGWTLTRETFSRAESVHVACLVGAVYAVVCASQIDPTGSMPAVVLLYGVVAYFVVASCQQNIRLLLQRLTHVRQQRMSLWERPLLLKLGMFRRLQALVSIYLGGTVAIRVVLQALLEETLVAHAALHVIELVTWAALCATFKARRRMPFFDIMQQWEPAASVAPLLTAVDSPPADPHIPFGPLSATQTGAANGQGAGGAVTDPREGLLSQQGSQAACSTGGRASPWSEAVVILNPSETDLLPGPLLPCEACRAQQGDEKSDVACTHLPRDALHHLALGMPSRPDGLGTHSSGFLALAWPRWLVERFSRPVGASRQVAPQGASGGGLRSPRTTAPASGGTATSSSMPSSHDSETRGMAGSGTAAPASSSSAAGGGLGLFDSFRAHFTRPQGRQRSRSSLLNRPLVEEGASTELPRSPPRVTVTPGP